MQEKPVTNLDEPDNNPPTPPASRPEASEPVGPPLQNGTDEKDVSSPLASESVTAEDKSDTKEEEESAAPLQENKSDTQTNSTPDEDVSAGAVKQMHGGEEEDSSSDLTDSDSSDSADDSTQSNVFYPNAEDGNYTLMVSDDKPSPHSPCSEGEQVDATGCNETEEIMVEPECRDAPASSNEDDDRSHEIHYSEPPEPMRDDNLAIDSDSDNESPMRRPRRVGFAQRTMDDGGQRGGAVNPHSMSCGNDFGPNILDDAPLGGGATDNILRQLLSRPPMNNGTGNTIISLGKAKVQLDVCIY